MFYLIHGNILPTPKLIKAVSKLKHSEFISVPGKEGIVYCISKQEVPDPNMIFFRSISVPFGARKANGAAGIHHTSE